jgi:hypothetical protein
MQSWIISIVIQFVLRQLGKFTDKLDWVKVKRDLDERIRSLLPGTWFDDEAVSIVNAALESIKSILTARDKIKPILELLAHEKFGEAAKMLLDLLKSHLGSVPLCEADCKVRNLLHEVKV